MALNIFKKKPKGPTYDQVVEATINDVLIKHREQVNRIDNLLPSEQDKSYALFKLLMKRFIRKVYDLPAAEHHHDTKPFGLVSHTFNVIIKALESQHQKIELLYDGHGHLDSQRNVKNKDRIFFRVALNALIHDAGKIFDVEIYSKSAQESYDATVRDGVGNLLDFKLQYPDAELTWKKNRKKQHESRGLIVLFDILTHDDRKFLSAVNWLQFMDQFLNYSPQDTVREIIHEADMNSVKEVFKVDENITEKEHKMLVAYFFIAAKDLIDKGGLKTSENATTGFVQVVNLDTVALIVQPAATQIIIQHMEKKYKLKTTVNHMISLLAKTNTIKCDQNGNPTVRGKLWLSSDPKAKFSKFTFLVVKKKYLYEGEIVPATTSKVEIDEFKEETDEYAIKITDLKSILEGKDEPVKKENTTEHSDINKTESEAPVEQKGSEEPNKDSNHKKESPLPSSQPELVKKEVNDQPVSELDANTESIKIFNTSDINIEKQLREIVEEYDIKKYQALMISLNLVLSKHSTFKHIATDVLNGKEVVVVNYPSGLIELNTLSGIINIFNQKNENELKIIHSIKQSMLQIPNHAKFEKNGKMVSVYPYKKWDEAIYIYKDSIEDAFSIEIKEK